MFQHDASRAVYRDHHCLDADLDRFAAVVCDTTSEGHHEAEGSSFHASGTRCFVSIFDD